MLCRRSEAAPICERKGKQIFIAEQIIRPRGRQRSFQCIAVGEGVAHLFAKRDITVMDRIEGYQLHFLYVGLAVFSQIFLPAYDVYNFGYDIETGLGFIEST